MNASESRLLSHVHGFNAKNLAKAIFKAEVPEEFVRTIPAQSVYMAVKELGLADSGDIIRIASLEQCRLLLDFDCWVGDSFNEEHFWEWLSTSDDEGGLEILQKLLKVFDYRLISILVSKYVDSQAFENPTEKPPAEGFYTPDKGYTWISINIEDGTKHLHFGRLLALIFETDAELFYQLLTVPEIATPSSLEEEAYQDRTKRLLGEGIPDLDYAGEIHAPISLSSFLSELPQSNPGKFHSSDIPVVEPLVYDSRIEVEPLATVLSEAKGRDSLEMEITLIVNAALTHFRADLADRAEVSFLIRQVKGALNIGLEIGVRESKLSPVELYEQVGFQRIYKLGLFYLFEVRKMGLKLKKQPDLDTNDLVLIDAVVKNFPAAPQALFETGDHGNAELVPFQHLAQLDKAQNILSAMAGK